MVPIVSTLNLSQDTLGKSTNISNMFYNSGAQVVFCLFKVFLCSSNNHVMLHFQISNPAQIIYVPLSSAEAVCYFNFSVQELFAHVFVLFQVFVTG